MRARLSSNSTEKERAEFDRFHEATKDNFWTLHEEIAAFVSRAQREFTEREIPWPVGESTSKEKDGKVWVRHQEQGIEIELPEGMKTASEYVEYTYGVDSLEWYKNEIVKYFLLADMIEDEKARIE